MNAGGIKYRPDIDGLRAVAILPVLLFHLGVTGFAGGFIGVDVFFVISGYLITSIILPEVESGTFSFRVFYERRVRRLFPALFAVLLASTAAALILLLPYDLRSFGDSLVATTLFGANVLFWQTAGYFGGSAEQKPLLHMWSLAVEEQFYIVFPLLLLLLYRFAPRRTRETVAVVALVSFVAAVVANEKAPDAAFYLPMFRAWELMLGVLLALRAVPPIRSGALRELLAAAGLAAIAFGVYALSEDTVFPGAYALFPTVGTAVLIHVGGSGGSRVSRALSHPVLVWIGLVSYPLYLWHWPLIVFAQYWLIRPLGVVEVVAVIALSFALAALTWRYIERPFRAKGIWTWPRLATTSALLGSVVVACGLLFRFAAGLPQRLDAQTRAQAMTAFEIHDFSRGCRETERYRVGDNLRCRVGTDAEPTFAVWGDSHAMALLPAFDSAARSVGAAGLVFARAGCPGLAGVDRVDQPGGGCSRFGEDAMHRIAETPTVRTVVLASRWAFHANGTRYGAEDGPQSVLSPDGIAGNAAVFTQALDSTVALLRQRGLRVVLLTQMPEVGWDVPSVLARSRRFGRPAPAGPTLAEYAERQELTAPALEDVARRHRAELFDLAAIFCDGASCAIQHRGQPLYKDDDHVSVYGTTLIAPYFEPLSR